MMYFDELYFVDDYMMGMSPNMMMYDLRVYDMIGCAHVFYVFHYLINYCGAVEFLGNANTHLQVISLKVSEHDWS